MRHSELFWNIFTSLEVAGRVRLPLSSRRSRTYASEVRKVKEQGVFECALLRSFGRGWWEMRLWVENFMLFLGGQCHKYATKHGIWVTNQHLLYDWGEIRVILGRYGLPRDPPESRALIWSQQFGFQVQEN